MRFKDKVLLATGAGSGLAAATAQRFTAEGGRVAVVDVDLDRAREVAGKLAGALALACDVSDEASVSAAVAQASQRLGRIDCLFNAAGHALYLPIEDMSLAQWNHMLAVHVTGTFLVCKAALPALRAAGGGSIVNVASVAALIGRRNLGAYSAAKGAILAFSRQLAVDLAPDNVRVNVIAPGSVRTAMTEPLAIARGGGDWAKGAAQISVDTLQKRVGLPEEIAAPVCFLLSDEASFFTGSLLVPDGGMTAI
jgi:NAD(P)-dependent dehydrogenase (short-subunit alcohol dehydrogenase family)